jgi:iron complex transport system substrate-binding protein
VVTPQEVARRAPEVIIASWCGRQARLDEIRARPEWRQVPAVRDGHVYEVPSDVILQAGPGLLEGARQLHALLWRAATDRS